MHPAFLPLFHKMAGHAVVISLTGAGLAALDFNNSVTTGSLIVAAGVIIAAGAVTWRSQIAKVWREEAEGEKARAARLELELKEALRERVEFEKEQQTLRHDLKDTIAAQKLQIQALEAKTDLTAAIASIREMNDGTVATVTKAVADAIRESSEARDGRLQLLLEEIRDRLTPPIPTTTTE